MRTMERSTTSRPPATNPRRPQAGADTDEPYIPHFRSLITPGVASSPLFPDWVHDRLRRLFRRKDTPAARS